MSKHEKYAPPKWTSRRRRELARQPRAIRRREIWQPPDNDILTIEPLAPVLGANRVTEITDNIKTKQG